MNTLHINEKLTSLLGITKHRRSLIYQNTKKAKLANGINEDHKPMISARLAFINVILLIRDTQIIQQTT